MNKCLLVQQEIRPVKPLAHGLWKHAPHHHAIKGQVPRDLELFEEHLVTNVIDADVLWTPTSQ